MQVGTVSQLRFGTRRDKLAAFQADAVLDDSVFHVMPEVRDLRRLRAGLMDAARVISTGMPRRSILILEYPQISKERLHIEFAELPRLFRSEILDNLALVVRYEDGIEEIIGQLSSEEKDALDAVTEHVRLHSPRPIRRPAEAFGDILRVLLIHWFRKHGPQPLKNLCQQTGFSYPTVASVLKRLAPSLLRHSDRRVELRSFPRDEWLTLAVQAEKIRVSQGFTDRSGNPRSPEALLQRLRALERTDIAVGGVMGARHYLPEIDIVGTPRLDLVIHSRRGVIPPQLPRLLDPALVPAKRGEPCQLVLHTLFRHESFFEASSDGLFWADEVECLFDLHEARLESQALEFLDGLLAKSKS